MAPIYSGWQAQRPRAPVVYCLFDKQYISNRQAKGARAPVVLFQCPDLWCSASSIKSSQRPRQYGGDYRKDGQRNIQLVDAIYSLWLQNTMAWWKCKCLMQNYIPWCKKILKLFQDMQLQPLDCNSVSEEGMGGRSVVLPKNSFYADIKIIWSFVVPQK